MKTQSTLRNPKKSKYPQETLMIPKASYVTLSNPNESNISMKIQSTLRNQKKSKYSQETLRIPKAPYGTQRNLKIPKET